MSKTMLSLGQSLYHSLKRRAINPPLQGIEVEQSNYPSHVARSGIFFEV